MTSSLITRHIPYLHSRKSCKCPLDTFPRNSSFNHHKYITRSGLFIIHSTCIIGITNDTSSVSTSICQHEMLGTLKIPQNFLCRFPVALTKITQVPTQTRRQYKQYQGLCILEHTSGCPQLKNKGLLSFYLTQYHFKDIGLWKIYHPLQLLSYHKNMIAY